MLVLRSIYNPRPGIPQDQEFAVRDGYLTISRLVQDVEMDNKCISLIKPSTKLEKWKPENGKSQCLALDIGTRGLLDTMRYVDDIDAKRPMGNDEVEIEAVAWPVNFRDVFSALGRLKNKGLGFECGGYVSRVGSGAASLYQPGDRVVAITIGCMRSHPRAPVGSVHKLPDSVSSLDAASIIGPLVTAYRSLIQIANLQSGEKILIHSATGGTGQMAVYLAKSIGAKIFATVGSLQKKKQLVKLFGIPEDHIFYSRDDSFAQGIKRLTGSVDVILNSLSGGLLEASWSCIAPYGRFIEIGKTDIMANSSLPMRFFANNVTYAAVDLHHIALKNQTLLGQLLTKSIDLYLDGTVQPPSPLHIYSVSEVEKAFRFMQSGKNMDRIIITMEPQNVVPKYLVPLSTWKCIENATYVIVGGFGGLGRSILEWMSRKGARNFLVLSRSGITTEAVSTLLVELKSKGIRVIAPHCNVSSPNELLLALEQCADLPPIRGCINAAMALQDAILDNMTRFQWLETVASKVLTSWNLHHYLPKDLDFYILLSSLGGIHGSAAQSNYAAGCSFQDALARYRTEMGLRMSVSLDLGWMRTIGIVAESKHAPKYQQHVRDMQPIEEADLLALLEYYCNPYSPQPQASQSQLLVGAVHPAYFRERGKTPPVWVLSPLFSGFSGFKTENRIDHSHEDDNSDAALLFSQANGSDKASFEIVLKALKRKLARALDVHVDYIESNKRLSDYGVDSLMAVELRTWILKDFRATVAVFDIVGEISIDAICELVVIRAKK